MALLDCHVGYDGPEGVVPGPEGAERVELVHPTGSPAAWLVPPGLPSDRRTALIALTSERLMLVQALDEVGRRPTLEEILECVTSCEQRVMDALTPAEVTRHIREGLQTLLGMVDRDEVTVTARPLAEPADAEGGQAVTLDPAGLKISVILGARSSSQWAVEVSRSPHERHRSASVLNRNHTSACALFERQLTSTLRAWHFATVGRIEAAVLGAFHQDWAGEASQAAERASAFQQTATALAGAFRAPRVRVCTLHRATLVEEVRGVVGAWSPPPAGVLRGVLVPVHTMASEGEAEAVCLPIGHIELETTTDDDRVGWRAIAAEISVRLADELCARRRLRLAERALKPVWGRVSEDPWQALVRRLREDLALAGACVAEAAADGAPRLVVSEGDDTSTQSVLAALSAAPFAPHADTWQSAFVDGMELWRLTLPAAAPHPTRSLVLAARRDPAWPEGANVLRQRDRDHARHVLDPFLAQLQTLDAIPHGALLLHREPSGGLANGQARQVLSALGSRENQEQAVEELLRASSVPGTPAWLTLDRAGLLVWRPAGTSRDLLLFSTLDGMRALGGALTMERLTSTSILHHLWRLIQLAGDSTNRLSELLTHGALTTIAAAISAWPSGLPEPTVLMERLLIGEQAPDAALVAERWRELGFSTALPRLLDLVAAVRRPEEPFAHGEHALLSAVNDADAPESLADALLRMAQVCNLVLSLRGTSDQLHGDGLLLDPDVGQPPAPLWVLLNSVEHMSRVMTRLEAAHVTFSFECVEELRTRRFPDAKLLEHALLNLVAHAIRAVAKVERGHVSVCVTRRGDELQITVEDNGAPLPAEIAAAPYLPPSADAAARGWGLHLTFAIARRAGGSMLPHQIEDISPSRQKKTFGLVLPLNGARGPTH